MNKQFAFFCLKFLLLLGLVVALDLVVGRGCVFLKDEGLRRNPESQWLKTAYTIEKLESDVLIIGSSKASHHYVPKLLSDNLGIISVYNCGQDGCFFLYQNCIINLILKKYSPSILIWDIQPDCLIEGSASREYQNIRYLSPYYYNEKCVKDYVDSESPTMKIKMFSRMFAYNSKVLNYMMPLVQKGSSTEQGYIPLYSSETDDVRYSLDDSPMFSPDYAKLQMVSNTLHRCAESGVDVKVLVSPVFADMSAYVELISNIRDIVEDCGFFFKDYSEVFGNDGEYFKDASHLNDTGARLYTQMLCEQMDW